VVYTDTVVQVLAEVCSLLRGCWPWRRGVHISSRIRLPHVSSGLWHLHLQPL